MIIILFFQWLIPWFLLLCKAYHLFDKYLLCDNHLLKPLLQLLLYCRLLKYYQKNNLGGCVLGISGGKDSAVVAAIMCDAIGRENVLGVTLPC